MNFDEMFEDLFIYFENEIDVETKEILKRILYFSNEVKRFGRELVGTNSIFNPLSPDELKEFKATLEYFIESAEENELSKDWIRHLERMLDRKIIRYDERFDIESQNSIENMIAYEDSKLEAFLIYLYGDVYSKTQSIFNNKNYLDVSEIIKDISRPWSPDNFNYSDRLNYQYKPLLKFNIMREIKLLAIRGGSAKEITEAIMRRFDLHSKQIARFIYNEAIHFLSKAEYEALKDNDVKWYKLKVVLDDRTSEICQELHLLNKVYPMNRFDIGVTAPPFHMNCRTTIYPFFPKIS